MSNKLTFILAGSLAVFFNSAIAANIADIQLCGSQYNEQQSKQARYIDHNNGSVSDKRTGLTWQVCALGQQWQKDNTCELTPGLYHWQEAMLLAKENTDSDSDNWRLPTIKELNSIVEYQCNNPAINQAVFPNAGKNMHWSSTYKKDFVKSGSIDYDLAISGIEFGSGTWYLGDAESIEMQVSARLVRNTH
jgi:hypothetical protein